MMNETKPFIPMAKDGPMLQDIVQKPNE